MSSEVSASKFLSLLLRHDPASIGLTLSPEGWAKVDDLVRLSAAGKLPLSRELIEAVVATSDKQRFIFSVDGQSIRANQGHSVRVDLGLTAQTPPDMLYHGTATRFLRDILDHGLARGSRQHVHLSANASTALAVGQRHGKPVVLVVQAKRLHDAGEVFFKSENGVWLVQSVPPQYLEALNEESLPEPEEQ